MAENCLKKILDDEGLTQTKLSWATGVSIGTINKVCRGKRTPSPRIVSLLLKGLQKLAEKEYKQESIFPRIRIK